MVPMPVFFGEMEHRDHPKKMPATVHVDKGTIRLQSGPTVLGEWKMYEVQIRERDSESITFRADQEELILTLKQHESFLSETAAYRRERRGPLREHEAFRAPDDGPTLGKELREDVGKEVSSVTDEIKELAGFLPEGPPLWIGLGVLLLLIIFLPGLVLWVLLGGGIVALVVGAIAYVETNVAVRLPGEVTPIRLIAVGAIGVVAGILIALIR